MLKLYITTNCASCKKAIRWLNNYEFQYETHNIFSKELMKGDVRDILIKTENGALDIISTRSKIYQEIGDKIEVMSMTELTDFIIKNPSVLRRPIIVDENRLQVGYNEEEIRVFLPKSIRDQKMMDLKRKIRALNRLEARTQEKKLENEKNEKKEKEENKE